MGGHIYGVWPLVLSLGNDIVIIFKKGLTGFVFFSSKSEVPGHFTQRQGPARVRDGQWHQSWTFCLMRKPYIFCPIRSRMSTTCAIHATCPASSSPMLDERQRIISSVFSRRNAQGVLEEEYVSHLKIWEDADGSKKLRYILLSQASAGTGYIHKSKLNSNGSFSVGKTWLLSDLRAIQVINPLVFNITLSRTYRWQTDDQDDQTNFLHSLIRLFRISSSAPLRLEGITEPEPLAGDDTSTKFDHTLRSAHSSSPSGQRDSIPTKAQPVYSARSDRLQLPTADRYRDPVPQTHSVPFTPTSQTTLQSVDQYQQSDTDLTVVNVPSISLHKGPTEDSLDKKAIVQSALLQSPSGSRTASPTPSSSSRKLPTAGKNHESNAPVNRKNPKTRISFFDSANQGVIERLLFSNVASQSTIEGEEETAQATMSNVEDMLEGYDWASDDVIGRKHAKGTVDLIEARLTGELMALENANIHSFWNLTIK
ncbi:exocyst complex component SEC3 N-terminal PIP2 binding PH-domain-containing protein [Amanita rubescens]|nr:exocyst complex component SEC3 N-terminal PIP2 binding PH-domain-containing protein [Amanita rubescens]